MTDQFLGATKMVLSPAAQAVLDAAWVDTGITLGDRKSTLSAQLAAALRAAVAHTQQHHGLGVWECDADELLAIAAELDGANHTSEGG